jgi:hypothetical protein
MPLNPCITTLEFVRAVHNSSFSHLVVLEETMLLCSSNLVVVVSFATVFKSKD